MTGSARRDRMQPDLLRLEAAFRERLLDELRKCAAGAWGLFGQNDAALASSFGSASLKRFVRDEVRELLDMTSEIQELRDQLGFAEPYPLCERLKSYRRLRGSNVPGESNLAKKFLDEIEAG